MNKINENIYEERGWAARRGEKMKLHEIFFRELNEGTLGEKEYPFTSREKSNWETLDELADHLFSKSGTDIVTEGNWVTLFEEDTKREFEFPQYDDMGKVHPYKL